VSALRPSALRRGRRRGRGGLAALGCALALLGGLAPAALAGQIVWSTGSGIWAMNDDGSDPHELISAQAQALAATLPSGTLASPDVFQNGGTTLLFVGETNAFASASDPAACGADCSATYELNRGVLTELGPAAAAAPGSAYYERQPRLTADGQELFSSSLLTGLGSTTSSAADALVERPLTGGASVTEWGATGSETEPAAGFDGTPDPADPAQAAWVQAQGCAYQVSGQPSCQYAVQFGPVSSPATAPVVIYDNEYASAQGQGPTSLALSSDGSTLLMVDPYAPNTGIYTTPVAGVPGAKPVTEVIAQPAGWTFGQARFAGSKIIFDAHQQLAGRTTGDIYAVAASCTTATCTFPASATNLTNDPAANSADPAWTSATTTIQPLRVLSPPRVISVSVRSRLIHTGKRLKLAVTLSAAATIVVTISGRVGSSHSSHSVGTREFTGKAGINRISFASVGGRLLRPGSYVAAISVSGSTAKPWTFHFGVRT
jgi:hypothetical protein